MFLPSAINESSTVSVSTLYVVDVPKMDKLPLMITSPSIVCLKLAVFARTTVLSTSTVTVLFVTVVVRPAPPEIVNVSVARLTTSFVPESAATVNAVEIVDELAIVITRPFAATWMIGITVEPP